MPTIKSSHLYSLLFSAVMGVSVAEASVAISNMPLQTGSAVEPNILFIIDDSGSMQWETMPDELTTHFGTTLTGNNATYTMWMFPRVAGIFGGSDYNNTRTVRFSGNTAAHFRSSHNNTVYYNPAFTYQPWSNPDGTLMAAATATAALNHPLGGFGTRNLTASNTQQARWVNDDGTHNNVNETFFPAVYYHYDGSGDLWQESSYQRVEIKPGNAPFSGHGREIVHSDGSRNRTDCATANACTYAEEIQNFANWYTYHRNRIFASKAGIGRGFAAQGDNMRVGYGTINTSSSSIDGVSTSTVVRGVRRFAGSDRSSFFDALYNQNIPAQGTPLRNALVGAGEYFSRSDSRGPWGLNPGFGAEPTIEHLTCRQSFSILMSDGYWGGTNPSGVGNEDNSNGPIHSRPDGTTYQYQPTAPFADGYSNTLADVAMKYWKNDLRPDLDNRVPTPNDNTNPAFWQHMVTFTVGLGVRGSIDPKTAFDAIGTETSIAWPDPGAAGALAPKIDDMLHAAVNSRGGFFSADDPETFAKELTRTLNQIADRVGSASNLAGTTTSLETDQMVFQGRFRSGDWSGDLWGFDADNVSGEPKWKVAEQLNTRAWAGRNIQFLDGSTQKAFTWSNLNSTQKGWLQSEALVDFIRGDRTREARENDASYQFRNRSSVLGDIAHSSPVYVAEPENRFYDRFQWDELNSYRTFIQTNRDRDPVVFIGSNSGMLHGFSAKTGEEMFAYIPSKLLPKLPALADPDYLHEYYVDGNATVSDVFIGGQWRSILVGSTGRGANLLFALDVTVPTSPQILWEFSDDRLGTMVGKPVIGRLKNGEWAVITGNGFNSSDHKAGLFLLNVQNGNLIKYINTGVGQNDFDLDGKTLSNGLSQVETWDDDNDGNVNYVFAGDYQGNVWKFDLNHSNVGQWDSYYKQGSNPRPLFSAENADGQRQSIMGGISVAADPETGKRWVFFGTGSYLSNDDPASSEVQSWYGLIDGEQIVSRAQLTERKINQQSLVSGRQVRSIEEGGTIDNKGWFIDLMVNGQKQGERIVNQPKIIGRGLVVNSIIPDTDICNPGGSGFVMAIDPFKGGRLNRNFFDINQDGTVDDGDTMSSPDGEVPVSGVGFDSMPGEPLFMGDEMVVGLTDTSIESILTSSGVRRGRVSWREMTN
ncbi:PilC/PilY family type IV pilus protein [Alkalimonas collagenimarina]|uniref:PilC/PilY family type IV pilus protein n=1 Tax=Alkalimonas collagenimarina TaxID=400390 RepID=A0ABT9H0M5_9GAMM|nr:PilC/PilY family type IV pilus protein [Alkalimonas collagenimarina]MDP4536853.1 PilC/PilY family type IV pilus protein [Alkalimonas collagenimarina]